MQPFGLMNFLKFALQASEQNQTPSTTAQTGETESLVGDFSPFSASFSPNSPQDNAPTESGNPDTVDNTLSQKEDAYRAFVEKHDRTSQKIKQKNK